MQTLRDFRNSWIDGALSGKKKLERLRAFFRFAVQSNWVKHNPILSIRPPKVSQPPTLPFSSAEMEKILWACDLYPDQLFALSGVEQAHPHRFRDTFAVGLLEQGVEIETVAVLLGHSSSAVTRKHYNPWVKSRQDQLEAAVRKVW